MDLISPPAALAELAAWLSDVPPGAVLLDHADLVWQALAAAEHPFDPDASPVTVLATVGNSMHWLQTSRLDMLDVARRGMARVLHWPEPAEPAEPAGSDGNRARGAGAGPDTADNPECPGAECCAEGAAVTEAVTSDA